MGQGLNLHLSDVSHCPEASGYPGLGYWFLFKSVEKNEQFSRAVRLSLFKKTNQKSPRNGVEMMECVYHSRQFVDSIWTRHLQPQTLVFINEGTWVSFLQGTKRWNPCSAQPTKIYYGITFPGNQLQVSLVNKSRDILWLLGAHESWHTIPNSPGEKCFKSLRFRHWADTDEVGCIDQRAKVQTRPQVHPTLEEWSPDSFPAYI